MKKFYHFSRMKGEKKHSQRKFQRWRLFLHVFSTSIHMLCDSNTCCTKLWILHFAYSLPFAAWFSHTSKFHMIFIYSKHFREFKMRAYEGTSRNSKLPFTIGNWHTLDISITKLMLTRTITRTLSTVAFHFFLPFEKSVIFVEFILFFQLYQFSQLQPIYRNLCLSRLNELTRLERVVKSIFEQRKKNTKTRKSKTLEEYIYQ